MSKPVLVLGTLLLLLSLGYLVLYGLTVFVALITSGSELVSHPQAWYAALAPFLFASYCAFSVLAARMVPVKFLMIAGIVLGLLAVPSFSISFSHGGGYLPILMALWGAFIFYLSKASAKSR